MDKGIKTIEAFDSNYFKFGDAFQVTSTNTGKMVNAILLYCEDDKLIFTIVDYASNSNGHESKTMYINMRDLKTTKIVRLIPEIE